MSVTQADGESLRKRTAGASAALHTADGRAGIAKLVQGFGAAAITLALIVVVLNQVFTLNVVSSSSGPFSVSSIQGPVTGAIALFGVSLLVVAAAAAIRQMGGTGGM